MLDRDQIIYAYEGWIPTFFHYLAQVTSGLIVTVHLLVASIFKKVQVDLGGTRKYNLNWLIYLSAILAIFYLAAVLMLLFDSETTQIHIHASWLFAATILALLVLLFFEPRILYGSNTGFRSASTQRSLLLTDEAEKEYYKQRLDQFFLNEQSYLDATFRQQDLANHLQVPKTKLSTIIGELYDQNFNQLINDKRIQVAIEKMQNNAWENLTIEGIGQEVGFKSRTTFYKAFQEKTGLTPSQFRKRLANS
ncbi:helix-turn-helix domain-containing protein [Lunatimonas salinarum]|uniref:helix-turn-helix domain-containing protein n=1 Tax=Lunatimonas salinarum TaxID=1774590 RepID=UPI001AE02703|nr:helix-turn-helix domain-containing protein [Lunatimonas salinarum]